MYTPVFIDKENYNSFLPAMEIEGASFWIGMVEAETGSACGIMGVDYIEEDGTLSFSVSCIQVPEDETAEDVKRALLEYLLYLAREMGCVSVFISETISEEKEEGEETLLSELGFFEEEKSLPLYSFCLRDLNVKKTKSDCSFMLLSEISDLQWEEFLLRSEDYSFTVMDRKDYDPRISLFLSEDRKNLEAGILFRQREDVLFVEVIAPYGSNEEALINDLIYWGMERAKKEFGTDKAIRLFLPADRTYRDVLMKVTGDQAKTAGRLTGFTYDVPVGPRA